MNNNYFLPDNYRSNPANKTLDEISGDSYWTKNRLRLSRDYQYCVYQKALAIAERDHLRTILDVGCGPAIKLNSCFKEKFEIFGVDQASITTYCSKTYQRGIYVADNFETPKYALKQHISSADLIICSDVIEHMSDPDRLIQFIKTFSDSKTTIIFSTPARDQLAGPNAVTPTNPAHIREWSFKEFACYLQDRGFQVLEHTLEIPFLFRFNLLTITFLVNRLIKFLPLQTNQMAICRLHAEKE